MLVAQRGPSKQEVMVETDRTVRDMGRNLLRAKQRSSLAQQQEQQRTPWTMFPRLPWWAYVLIALHLGYRLFKVG